MTPNNIQSNTICKNYIYYSFPTKSLCSKGRIRICFSGKLTFGVVLNFNVFKTLILINRSTYKRLISHVYSSALMFKCWEESPADRPNFENLKNILDKILNAKEKIEAEYRDTVSCFLEN